MRRREFIAGLGAAAWPLAARAQEVVELRHVSLLMSTANNDPGGLGDVTAFRERLSQLGWTVGHNVSVDVRWPGGNVDLIEKSATEVVKLKPDVVVARSSPIIAALKKQTNTIPIVFVNVTEPVEQGFVQSLPRPGGNITGFTNFETTIGGKMLEFLKDLDQRIERVAIIYNPQTAPFWKSYRRSIEGAGAMLGVEVTSIPVLRESEIEVGIANFARRPSGALIQITDSFTLEHRALIAAQAALYRLPSLFSIYYTGGSFDGLMAYSVDVPELMRGAAGYVDRILRGANPAELPVQLPARFKLVINRKVAEALGLMISPQLSMFANEIIE
jgi:putative tryptophan/tyrosine transport system substrate-binding protein